VVEDRVILTDGVKVVSVEAHNFSNFREIPVDLNGFKNYDYQFASENELLKFTLCHYSQADGFGILLAVWNTALRIYHLTDSATKAVLHAELLPPTGTLFNDALPDHGKYWALAEGTFVAFRPNEKGELDVSIVELESKECTTLSKFETTLHMICKEGGLNYVG
jgi:hypothetical protein